MTLPNQYPLAMNVEKAENGRKKNTSIKPAESTKKETTNSRAKKALQKRIDSTDWLELFAAETHPDKLFELIPQLNREFQKIASELVIAISDTKAKPTSKFKIDRLPSAFLNILVNKSSNPFYLVALLCGSVTESDLKNKIFIKLSSCLITNEDLDYFLNRLSNIREVQSKEYVWNLFLSNDILISENWQQNQLKILDWGISQGLHISRPQEVLIALRSAAAQFKLIDTPHRNRFYRKLLEIDVLTFIAFLIHISAETLNLKTMEQIIAKKNVEVLLVYFENRQLLSGPWLEIFEQQFVGPVLKDTLDRIMNFEELLPFLTKHAQLSHLVASDTLSRAVSRSFKRDDLLSNLLTDVRVSQLTRQNERLTEESSQLQAELNSEKFRNHESEKRIRDFESAINSYETRLRSQMKSENLGSDAMSQSAKVEVIRSLVDGLDHLIHDSEGFELERALQKMGIVRLGDPGAIFTWDSELCETLTGVSIENGIVVRSGYTWLNGSNKVVIRRVLLKLA